MNRVRAALVAALAALAVAAVLPRPARPDPATLPPNVIVILTDDQTIDTLPSDPAAMPWLQSQIFDAPDGHWLWFPHAYISTPLCCPSRATILTGRYAHHTLVQDNAEGQNLDESNTLATWLHGAGYTTALFGKYLNEYPWNRGPYVPPGWSRFVGKNNTDQGQTYYGYREVNQGVPLSVGTSEAAYATDHYADLAVDFLASTSPDRPYFMMYTPSAPHQPWIPARHDIGAFSGVRIPGPSHRMLFDVRGKPAWVRGLPAPTAADLAWDRASRRREFVTLLAVDDAVRRIVQAVAARGELDRTVIFFLTDNGYEFGEHRWRGKKCPYEPCIRTPLAVWSPWRSAASVPLPVSNVDLAPTIADLADVVPGLPEDGSSFAGALGEPAARGGVSAPPPPPDRALYFEWAGDATLPAWQAVRTPDFAYIESVDGSIELYDLTGALGRPDPHELRNVAGLPRYATTRIRLAKTLADLASAGGGAG